MQINLPLKLFIVNQLSQSFYVDLKGKYKGMKFKIHPLLIFMFLFFVFLCKHSFSQEFTMPSFIHAIDACDMDMDGSNDIVVSCSYEDSIVILFNDGFGNFNLEYYSRLTSNLIPNSDINTY
jgi:hypothetical protein